MAHRTLTIPRLSGSEAQALTTLARHGVNLPLPSWPGLQTQTATMSLSCMTLGSPVMLAPSAVRMVVAWAGASLWLDLPQTAAERWLVGSLGAVWPHWPELAPEWQHLAQRQASGWLAQALSQAGRGSAECVGFENQDGLLPVGARHHLLVTLQVQTDAALPADVFHGVLHTDSLGLLLVAGLVADHPGQTAAVLDPDLCPQTFTLCLGETQLPLSAVEKFQPGQVVLVQQRFAQGEQQLSLRSESAKAPWMAWQARLDNHHLHILSTVQTMTLPETFSTALQSTDTEPEFLAQLPVRVSFDLGETVLSLAQVRALQPGETVPLQRPVQEYVTIRANGMPIGTGQLVEIDGRLGVAIGSLALVMPSLAAE